MSAQVENKLWYALITKPRQDKKLARYLESRNIEHYLPLIKVKKQWSDRLKTIEVPVMSPYLFIKSTQVDRKLVFGSGSVLEFVQNKGCPALISNSEIQLVQSICKYGIEPDFINTEIQCGDYVSISGGLFKGLIGQITEEHGRLRFGIRLEGLGCWARFVIDKRFVSKLNRT